jgi:hypothetical protein
VGLADVPTQELPNLSLADALALTCVLRHDPTRFDTAALRWHGRFVREVRGVSVADAGLALTALGSMRTSFEMGATALGAVCEEHERSDLAEVLDAAMGVR